MYLALDQGGQSSRALVFDDHGRVRARAAAPIATRRESGGRVEHDPREVVDSLGQVALDALAGLPDDAPKVRAAGIACQRSSLLCWDAATGAPLTPVLSWQDSRHGAWLAQFESESERISRITGLRPSAHYGASKFRWCLDEVPAVRRARDEGRLAWGPLGSYLLQELSVDRPRVVDASNAQRTLLLDIHRVDWDPGLVSLFGLDGGALPELTDSRGEFGLLVGVADEIPLQVLTGDQSAAFFAHGVPRPGEVTVNVGTGAFLQRLAPDGAPRPPSLLMTVGWREGTRTRRSWEGSVHGAAAALQQLAGELGIESIEPGLATWLEAERDPPLFLNGISGLGSPWWQPDFESRFEGSASPEASLVGVAESIVFHLQTNLEALAAGGPSLESIQVSGGVSRLDPFCERLASLSGLPVRRPPEVEATARGLGWLLSGQDEPWPVSGETRRFDPRPDPALGSRYERWRALMPPVPADPGSPESSTI